MINKKSIKTRKTSLMNEKRGGDERQVKCNYRQTNPKKIQRFLPRKYNKQISNGGEINKGLFGEEKIMVKNESEKDLILYEFLSKSRNFSNKWETKKTKNKIISEILKKSSKKSNGNRGEPDFLYVNESKKLLILVENKDGIKNHSSEKRDNPIHFAVDGIIHYLSFFSKENLSKHNKIDKHFQPSLLLKV